MHVATHINIYISTVCVLLYIYVEKSKKKRLKSCLLGNKFLGPNGPPPGTITIRCLSRAITDSVSRM